MNPTKIVSVLKRMKRNFVATPYLHLAATGTIGLCLLITGCFIILYTNLNDLIEVWQQDIRIVAYIKDGVSDRQRTLLAQTISKLNGVKEVSYTSKDEALTQLRQQMKHRSSLLDGLHTNPLPASFTIDLVESQKNRVNVTLLSRKINEFPEINDVEYAKAWLHRFSGFISFFRLASLVVGLVVFATTVFICSNTIGLTLYAQRDELDIMRLVGATDSFIKAPFYIQNLIQGLLGSLLAITLLFAVYNIFIAKIEAYGALMATWEVRFLSLTEVYELLLIGVVIAWLGSYISLKQFLKS
ncbi:MAG: hypothetical protein BBJ60_06855 [Desulfobacterales bacterium S7086C20]|nr:MAG: hypothetical protein BBJ60_06855 [Desulfobacterales bacterium S7086C20]